MKLVSYLYITILLSLLALISSCTDEDIIKRHNYNIEEDIFPLELKAITNKSVTVFSMISLAADRVTTSFFSTPNFNEVTTGIPSSML